MSGEYIQANTIEEYWSSLKAIYQSRSTDWQDLTAEDYNSIEHSEREDSDNHLNEERLGEESDVIDICHYKFLPDRWAAYAIQVKHKDGKSQEFYFKIKLKEQQD